MGEAADVELKARLDPTDRRDQLKLVAELVAMANADGGTIRIGVAAAPADPAARPRPGPGGTPAVLRSTNTTAHDLADSAGPQGCACPPPSRLLRCCDTRARARPLRSTVAAQADRRVPRAGPSPQRIGQRGGNRASSSQLRSTTTWWPLERSGAWETRGATWQTNCQPVCERSSPAPSPPTSSSTVGSILDAPGRTGCSSTGSASAWTRSSTPTRAACACEVLNQGPGTSPPPGPRPRRRHP